MHFACIQAADASRIEEGRGTEQPYGRPTRFPSPLIKPDVPFRASGFPTDFTNGSRTRSQVNIAQSQHAQIPEHTRVRESGSAARSHLVTVSQEVPHALIDVVIDRSIRHQTRSVTEVVRPPPQNSVEAIAHVRPRYHVARHQQVSHFLPQPGNALLRRTRPEVHMAILPKMMR